MKKTLYTLACASSVLMADAQMDELRAQLEKQQETIDTLAKKVENQHSEAEHFHTPQEKSSTFSQSAYMPDLSLIADVSYVHRDMKDDEVAHLEIPGIAHGILGTHEHGGVTHSPYNGNNGFNKYAEVGISKSVDPNFNLYSVFHFSNSGVEVEELYFTSQILGNGLRLKAGQFFSNFGYLNEQHHHVWSFADMPLVYEGFLGTHGINEMGAQLQWTAPTETYLMLGGEILQGTNRFMFGNASIGDPEDPMIASTRAPSLGIVYAKTSFDFDDTSVLAGLSYAHGSTRIDHTDMEESPHAYSGNSKLYGADLVVKHYFDSYSSLTWQSEYLYRDMEGTYYGIDETTGDVTGTAAMRKKQAGYYTQLVYAMDQNWQMGVRYDAFTKNEVTRDGLDTNQPDDLSKYSAMIQYSTSEFARFRLQYNHNTALYNEDGERQDINTVILQANIAIGPHGAHSF